MEVSALNYSGVSGLHGRSPLLRLQSDERLVALMRRGNHAAFEHLVGRYQSRLLAFCRHMLVSVEDAEDVLQDVFAAAFNAILADDRPINVRPWLYRIARNRSLNHLRRVQAVGVDSMDVHFSDHGATAADQVHQREEFRLLVGDIHDLPETQRTALLLREMEALSYEQIAEAMETTIPSVKSLLVRARVSLAEASEARQLTCEEVRFELGEVAEGLRRRSTPPVRRHLRGCDRCSTFRSQLQQTNRALAALLPVGPFVVLHKLFFLHLGHGAGAGAGSHATAAAGSTAMAGSSAAGTTAAGSTVAVGSTVAAGTAVATGSTATGLVSAGIGAVATKAAAGLAAAAIVTAGAVEVGQNVRQTRDLRGAPISAAVITPAGKPLVSRQLGVHDARRVVHRAALKATTRKPPLTPVAKTTPVPVAPVTVTPVTTPAASVPPGRTETTSVTTTLPPTGVGATPGAMTTTPSVTATPTSTTGSCTSAPTGAGTAGGSAPAGTSTTATPPASGATTTAGSNSTTTATGSGSTTTVTGSSSTTTPSTTTSNPPPTCTLTDSAVGASGTTGSAQAGAASPATVR